jgi:hypothetical protein
MKPWVFHNEKWPWDFRTDTDPIVNGTITVSVMPLSGPNGVVDSNVGVIVECEHPGAPKKVINEGGVEACAVCGAVPGAVVTKHGQKPNCDLKALARIIGFSNACDVLDQKTAMHYGGAV